MLYFGPTVRGQGHDGDRSDTHQRKERLDEMDAVGQWNRALLALPLAPQKEMGFTPCGIRFDVSCLRGTLSSSFKGYA